MMKAVFFILPKASLLKMSFVLSFIAALMTTTSDRSKSWSKVTNSAPKASDFACVAV
jgi:hypothetical protein